MSADELAQVLAASTAHAYPYRPIVRLLILTGQRRGEIAALEWNWIDEHARTITLPASLTKNGRAHVFPFGDLVQETLSALPRFDDLLFPSRSSKATIFNGWGKPRSALTPN